MTIDDPLFRNIDQVEDRMIHYFRDHKILKPAGCPAVQSLLFEFRMIQNCHSEQAETCNLSQSEARDSGYTSNSSYVAKISTKYWCSIH